MFAMSPSLLSALCALYANEINVSVCVSSCWDEGWLVKLGDRVHGFKVAKTFANAELDKVADWLSEQTSFHYPETDFARRYVQYRAARPRRKRAKATKSPQGEAERA